MDFALVHRERKRMALNTNTVLVGDVAGKVCIIIDDIADTCSTLISAAHLLVQNGATKVIAVITHGILSNNAATKIMNSKVDELVVSNTVPQNSHILQCPKIKVMDVTAMFAEAIRRAHNGESVSFLSDKVPY